MDFSDLYQKDNKQPVRDQANKSVPRLAPEATFLSGIYDIWALDDLYFEGSYVQENDDLTSKYSLLSWVVSQTALSPSALIMLDEAMENGWCLALEDLNGPDFHLDVPEKLIVLDNNAMLISALGRSEYFRNMLLVSFIRALRDVWQEKRHGGFDEEYAPEDILMLERVRSADMDILAVLTAWEIREQGQGGLWRHIIGSEDGDIAMRFSGYLERYPSSSSNGQAFAAAFAQWFRDESRVNACEHEVLNDLDALIEEREGGQNAFGHEKLTRIKLEMLSCLPDRSAYLQGRGAEILGDPLYAGMHDAVNQAHLMQIIYDAGITRVQGVPFRDTKLAEKIFPGGEFTPANDIPVK